MNLHAKANRQHAEAIAALGVVGAMTFVVIEPLNPSHNVVFDQAYIDHFVQQIADFCVNAVQRP